MNISMSAWGALPSPPPRAQDAGVDRPPQKTPGAPRLTHRRRGHALLVALGALALAVVAWVLLADRAPSTETPPGGLQVPSDGSALALSPESVQQDEPALSDRTNHELPPSVRRGTPQPTGAGLPSSAGNSRGRLRQPDGRPIGIIRGRLSLNGVARLDGPWKLILEPSRFAIGAELAERRELELPGAERDFEVTGLPLAGYDVRAEYPGLNGRALPLVLRKGAEATYVVIELSPSADVAGRLINSEGLGEEGISVHLRATGTSVDLSTVSDALGDYRFDDVLDGNYTLRVGAANAPILDPLSIQVRAPRMTVPDLEVPSLGRLRIEVVDPFDTPQPDVEVFGGGNGGGSIDVTTDSTGTALATLLPAGRYSLRAQVEGLGRGFAKVDVEPSEGVTQVRLVLRP